MVQIGDKAGDRTLEVDVVLPEGIVGVDEQGLIRSATSGLGREDIRRWCRGRH